MLSSVIVEHPLQNAYRRALTLINIVFSAFSFSVQVHAAVFVRGVVLETPLRGHTLVLIHHTVYDPSSPSASQTQYHTQGT